MCLIPHRWGLWNAEVLRRVGVFWEDLQEEELLQLRVCDAGSLGNILYLNLVAVHGYSEAVHIVLFGLVWLLPIFGMPAAQYLGIVFLALVCLRRLATSYSAQYV